MRAIQSRNLRLKFSTVKFYLVAKILFSGSSIYSPGLRVARLERMFIFIQMNHISLKLGMTKSLRSISKNVSLNKMTILVSVSFCRNLACIFTLRRILKKIIIGVISISCIMF